MPSGPANYWPNQPLARSETPARSSLTRQVGRGGLEPSDITLIERALYR
jgi:hypothetical protein